MLSFVCLAPYSINQQDKTDNIEPLIFNKFNKIVEQ
jgi:hypothetical protein